MNCEDKTRLSAGNCERSEESVVSREISRETKVQIIREINIQTADVVMVGNNNVIICYEKEAFCNDSDVSGPQSHSTSRDRKQENEFSINSPPSEERTKAFESDKEERGKELNASRNFSRYPKRNCKRKGFRKKSCSSNVRANFVQVVFPENVVSVSQLSDAEREKERDTVYDIYIDAKYVQIGNDNSFLDNGKMNCVPFQAKSVNYQNQRQRPRNRKGENAKFTKRQKLDCIMKELHKHRDNGQWEEFEKMTSEVLNENAGNTDIRIYVLLEKSVAVNYQKKLKHALALAQEALSLAPHASQSMVDVFHGRAYYCLVCVYKRTNEFEKAFENIKRSEERLAKSDSVLDKAFLSYEKGCVLLASASYDPPDSPRREKQLNEAEECFEGCLKLCWQMYNKGEKKYLNKDLFAMMKKVTLMLDCYTKNGRSGQVSSRNVEKAKEYLDEIQENQDLWERVADFPIVRVQFELARADYFFRKENYRKAKEHAEAAVRLAIDGGFYTDVEPANERLADIQERLAHNLGI